MALTATVASVAATAASVYQGYETYQAQKEAQKEQEEANQIEQRRGQLQQQENIRRAVARSRVARAQAEAAGSAQGGGASVAAQGAAGAETTGTAANIGFAIGQQSLEQRRFDTLINVGEANLRAQRSAAIGQFAGQASQFGGGGTGFANVARYGYNRFSGNQG